MAPRDVWALRAGPGPTDAAAGRWTNAAGCRPGACAPESWELTLGPRGCRTNLVPKWVAAPWVPIGQPLGTEAASHLVEGNPSTRSRNDPGWVDLILRLLGNQAEPTPKL